MTPIKTYIQENKDISGKGLYGLPMFAYTYINDTCFLKTLNA